MYLYFIFVIFLMTEQCSCTDVCEKVNECKCKFNNGTGIDLSSLDSSKIETITSPAYIYHPCATQTETGCPNNTAFCRTNKDGSMVELGNTKNVEFKVNPFDDSINVQYIVFNGTISNHTTMIKLECLDSETKSFMVDVTNSDNPAIVKLISKAGCLVPIYDDTGFSKGSVLVILFIVFTSVYFCGGIAVLKFIRGATGVEIIPHYEFWSDLPFLVKDGIIFTLSGFRTASSYDRI